MKFQTATATLLSLISTVVGQYDTIIPSPVCAKFRDIKVKGRGEFVDTDGSGIVPQTTGDMSISFNLSGVNALASYPNQPVFRQISLNMNAVCVVKRDQDPAPTDAPVCLYEAEMEFCRNWFLWYKLSEVRVERVSNDKVVDVAQLLENDAPREIRTQSIRGSGVNIDAEQESTPDNRQSLFGSNEVVVREDMVDAVRVTKEVFNLDPDLMGIVCPQLGCWVPYWFCRDKRKGGFTAHGTGSQDIKITGGTAGLFGAFGQILTADSGIVFTDIDYMTGDLTYTFDMGLEICYYRRESGFW